MSNRKVTLLDHNKIEWPYEHDPRLVIPAPHWTRVEVVDPWPAYHHDMDVVRETVELVEEAWPLPRPFSPKYFVLGFEAPNRANAATNRNFDYYSAKAETIKEEGGLPEWFPYILFYGKRTPIHPAVTRYLVSHEYGHVVDYYIERMLGYEPDQNHLDKIYAEKRNLKGGNKYGAKNWHSETGEIIANDFRVLMTGIETEFWPHDVPRPIEGTELHKWWISMKERASD